MDKIQLGYYFVRPDMKRAKLNDYGIFYKMHMMRINKKRPGIILEKVNPENYMGLWRSGRRGAT